MKQPIKTLIVDDEPLARDALRVLLEAGKLIMEIRQPVGRLKAELLPESETRFFRTDVDVQVNFVRDEKGQVTGLTVYQQGAEYRARKIG